MTPATQHPHCLKQQQQDPHLRSWQRTDRWSGCGPDLVIEFICSVICQLCALQLPLLFTQGPVCSQTGAATEEPFMVMSCLPANYRDFLGPGQRQLLTMINSTAWRAPLPLLPGPLPWLQKSRRCCSGDDHQALTASFVWAGHLLLLSLGPPGQFQGTSYLPSSTNLEPRNTESEKWWRHQWLDEWVDDLEMVRGRVLPQLGLECLRWTLYFLRKHDHLCPSSMYSAILRELLATDFLYNFTNTNKLHAFQTPSIEFLYHRYIIVCKHEKL